jgi:hypothetical protein
MSIFSHSKELEFAIPCASRYRNHASNAFCRFDTRLAIYALSFSAGVFTGEASASDFSISRMVARAPFSDETSVSTTPRRTSRSSQNGPVFVTRFVARHRLFGDS